MKKVSLTVICLFVLFSLWARGESCRAYKCDTDIVIRGCVLEKNSGSPIENANIFSRSCREKTNCLTDANGFFEIPVCSIGYHQFSITARGYASSRISLRIEKDKEVAEQKIELSPSSKVAGFVKNEAGEPVAGVRIRTAPFAQDNIETDASGFFEIDGINPQERLYTLYVSAENYPAESVQFSPAQAGMTAKCDVLLKQGVTIFGRITDSEGEPVSDAAVGPVPKHSMLKQTTTDANGCYKLENIKKGELVLSVFNSGYSPYVRKVQIARQETERQIDIELENPKPLRGRVVGKQGNGIEAVKIRILRFNEVHDIYPRDQECITDSQGNFIIENGPSSGRLEFVVSSDKISGKTIEVDCGKGEQTIEVDLGGEIYGRIVDDATDKPVTKFNVKLRHSRVSRGGFGGYSSTWSRQGHNFDDPNGLFDTTDERLAVGAEYAVTVCAEGYDLLTIDPVEVQITSAKPNRTIFRLKPAVTVGGGVVDSNGVAVEGAMVRWFSEYNTLSLNDQHHWSDIDTVTTNAGGMFSFDTIGAGKRGICIVKDGYAPYINSNLVIPDDASKLSRIVLEKGANIVGTVFKEGRPQAGVEMSCDFHSRYDLNRMGYIDKRVFSDTQGNYTFSDLPSGEIRIYMMSPVVNRSRYTLASKKLNLQSGETTRLDFGNEEGYTVTGKVTMGQSFLSNARVSFSKEGFNKAAVSDSNGSFKIDGIEKGQYEVRTEHREPLDSESGRVTFYTNDRITDTRQIQVDSDMNITIDFGASSLGGTIPAEFIDSQSKDFFVGARKWEPKEQTYLRGMAYNTNWQSAGSSRPDAEGNFEIRNLRPGKYFAVLYEFGRTRAVSEIFELGDSEKVDNINLIVPEAKLRVTVVDAQDKKPINGATCMLYNKDLELHFFGLLKDHPQANSFLTDANGSIEYVNLPQGSYMLLSDQKGYLNGNTDFKIDDGRAAEMQVALEKSAVVQFKLAKDVNESITKPMAYMYFKITDVKSGRLFTVPTHLGLMEEMFVYLKRLPCNPEDYEPDQYIDLPAGKYRIDYEVCQSELGNYEGKDPTITGQVEVDVTAGRTTQVVIGKN